MLSAVLVALLCTMRRAEANPLCNLYAAMLDRVGAPVNRFGDSTGPLAGLDDPTSGGTGVG